MGPCRPAGGIMGHGTGVSGTDGIEDPDHDRPRAPASAGCLGSSRSTRASSGRAGSRAGGGAAPTARPSSSASSSGRATSIPRSSRTAQSPTLQGIIRGRVDPRTVINSDGWRGYHGLVDLGYGHVRVDHARDEFTKGTVHINGIEGFWGLAKVRLTPFKGLPKHTFHLHLKETEWRYNHRRADKYKCLLQYLRKNPLS